VGIERRQTGRRAEVVKAVVTHIVQNPEGTVTLQGLQDSLHVPPEAASRIVQRLVSAGIVREVRQGVWSRVPDLPPASA
jgi:DNA-binding IscR family transcriptional regulator